jgi:hypothetical protein
MSEQQNNRLRHKLHSKNEGIPKGSSHSFAQIDIFPNDSPHDLTADSPQSRKAASYQETTVRGSQTVTPGVTDPVQRVGNGHISKAPTPSNTAGPVLIFNMFTSLQRAKANTSKEAQVSKASLRENRTGLPDQLKQGIEYNSGLDLSNVRVHYNSARPNQLNAHAFAQGNQIHLAPG